MDGEGSEVEPADPEIDQGAGGIQIDKIEFSLNPRISFTVGSEIDLDLGATSSTGLAIAYVAEGLPSWLNIIDGHLRGTAPSTTGSFNLTVTAKNEKGSVAQRSAVYVLPAHIEMNTTPLQMVSGQALSVPLQASNGASNANFVYTLISAQGATATIDESMLTASYALPGTYELVIEAQDVNSPQISRNTFRIPVVVDVIPLTISVADLDTTQYVTTLERFTAAGGWGGYQFRVVEGSLPAGLSLKWDGTLSGAPRDTDTRSVTIEVVDNKGLTARGVVTITVKGNPAITPAGSLTTAVGPYSAIFSADSSQLYLATNQTISLVDIATSTTIKQLKIGTNRSAALSPDGNRYAVASDGALQVYDAKTLEKVNEIKVGTSAMAVVWSADSNTLHFARSKSGSVAELVSYDASTGAVLGSVAFGKTGSGWRIDALADGRVLATASGSSGIYVLDTLSGTTRVITPTLTSYFVAAAPGNTAWTGAGGTLRRVDLETGDVIATHSIKGIVLAGLTMSPDGRWLYVSDSRNLIAVDTRDGSEVVRVPLPSGMSPRTTVSPDGRMVAVTGGPNTTTLLKFTASD
ncbi:WD40 repeat domain-containing protein [Microbacterium sp. SL62]|uniref:WD40 repeat domain-containing protein n=1 Tax=Microbacterium sp. SL62 TaxID=2995139 RepID=UPI002276D674|nr:WD40 repeat domain-containing protein [Microbacterium sp. SL62]MCY1718484.1 WD40 repeat domain-containing protein [Microbacterium sp. SL62]